MLITLNVYMLIAKFEIKTSFSHEIIGIIFQNYQERKQMDSGTGFCTYIVYFLYRWRISDPAPSPCPTAGLQNFPPPPWPLLCILSFCCADPLLHETLYSAPILWCIMGNLGTGDLGDFMCHGVGAKVLKSEGGLPWWRSGWESAC